MAVQGKAADHEALFLRHSCKFLTLLLTQHISYSFMPGLLDALALLILFPTLLPRSTSSPLPNPTDAIAALVHTIHTTLGFRLIPSINIPLTGPALQDRPTEEDFDDGASETATAVDLEEDVGATEGQLPTGWNARGEDSYVFEYRHSQSAMSFRVRVGRMGGRVQIDAMAEVDLSLDRRVLLSKTEIPLRSTSYAEWCPSHCLRGPWRPSHPASVPHPELSHCDHPKFKLNRSPRQVDRFQVCHSVSISSLSTSSIVPLSLSLASKPLQINIKRTS